MLKTYVWNLFIDSLMFIKNSFVDTKLICWCLVCWWLICWFLLNECNIKKNFYIFIKKHTNIMNVIKNIICEKTFLLCITDLVGNKPQSTLVHWQSMDSINLGPLIQLPNKTNMHGSANKSLDLPIDSKSNIPLSLITNRVGSFPTLHYNDRVDKEE